MPSGDSNRTEVEAHFCEGLVGAAKQTQGWVITGVGFSRSNARISGVDKKNGGQNQTIYGDMMAI
jgi:hypothetical protein